MPALKYLGHDLQMICTRSVRGVVRCSLVVAPIMYICAIMVDSTPTNLASFLDKGVPANGWLIDTTERTLCSDNTPPLLGRI